MNLKNVFPSAIILCFLILAVSYSDSEGARRVITFKNSEEETADDLHIEFSKHVIIDWDNTSPFDSERGKKNHPKHNLYKGDGGGVAADGTAKVTVEDADQTTIKINKWWWTKGGNANQDGEKLGEEKQDGNGILACLPGPATGDGVILVSVAGIEDTYYTTAGQTSSEFFAELVSFFENFLLSGDPMIFSAELDGVSMFIAGNYLGDPNLGLNIQILNPDMGLQLDWEPSGPIPFLNFADGCEYQDGFCQDLFLLAGVPGRSDVWLNANGTGSPFILGDSLAVLGPEVGGDVPPWEAYLWFHITRKGPGINESNYAGWKARLEADPDLGFVPVRMDSVEALTPSSDKFCSYFHEDDPGFNLVYPDLSGENEILPDDLFTPGTKIEYFVSGNYVGSTYFSTTPDTCGGDFLEFEILPSMRWIGQPGSDIVWPCLLYIDPENIDAQQIIDPALGYILQEVPGEGPNFDRYDELGAEEEHSGSSFYRTLGGNNGAGLPQLLGYQTILLCSGILSPGTMHEWDIIGLSDWLTTSICNADYMRQGLILSGDQIAGIIEYHKPSFLNLVGAGVLCVPYRDGGCPPGAPADNSFCVQIIDSDPPVSPTLIDYWAWGNGIPNLFDFTVLFTQGGGIGNRNWFDYDESGPKGIVEYAQIVNENMGPANFRSVLYGYSYHHITTSFEGGECVADLAGIGSAATAEILNALNWFYDGMPGAFCTDPCTDTADAEDWSGVEAPVNRLYQNQPNPFNPRAMIRFSVSRPATVNLSIYDITGRQVKKLVDGPMETGIHKVSWSGLDDAGNKVTSGVYWSQLRIGDYISNKKMVLLK